MTQHLFTIYDSAAGLFLNPFVAPSIEVAIREFRKMVNTEGNNFNTFPEDFTLYHVGEFEPETGTINPVMHHSLGVAQTFVNTPTNFEDKNNG